MRKAVLAAVVVAAVAVAGVVAVRRQHETHHISVPRNVPASVDGVPYGGVMPWADAVSDPANPRRIFVWVDGRTLRGVRSCGTQLQRAVTSATATTMTVFVAGYVRPLPSDSACTLQAVAPQRLAVTLPGPIGRRALVDAFDGRWHRLLNAARVPSIGAPLPVGLTPRPLQWDERSRVATRFSVGRSSSRSLVLRWGPPASALFPSPTDLTVVRRAPTTVEHRPALLDTVRTPAGVEYLVTWTRADGTKVVVDAPGFPAARVVALARSVH